MALKKNPSEILSSASNPTPEIDDLAPPGYVLKPVAYALRDIQKRSEAGIVDTSPPASPLASPPGVSGNIRG